jgi:hypothetical protein
MIYLHDIQWIAFVIFKFNFRLPWLHIYNPERAGLGIVLVDNGHRLGGPGQSMKRPPQRATRVSASSLEARAVMWEREPARRVRAAVFDEACGCWLASIPQGG